VTDVRASTSSCVFEGLNADRDSVADVDVLADLTEQELAELVRTAW
jgi:diacylglycerol O-acyltransferase